MDSVSGRGKDLDILGIGKVKQVKPGPILVGPRRSAGPMKISSRTKHVAHLFVNFLFIFKTHMLKINPSRD